MRVPTNSVLLVLPCRPRTSPCSGHGSRTHRLVEHHPLHRHGEPIKTVRLPEAAGLPGWANLADGGSAEVGIIGREDGRVVRAVPARIGPSPDVLVQGSGTALRLETSASGGIGPNPTFRLYLCRAMPWPGISKVHRVAACSARHHVDQRLARKAVLMAHDRAGGDRLPVTDLVLDAGLSAAPASLLPRGNLQWAGSLYVCGHVTITDRAGSRSLRLRMLRAIHAGYERSPGAAAVDGPRRTPLTWVAGRFRPPAQRSRQWRCAGPAPPPPRRRPPPARRVRRSGAPALGVGHPCPRRQLLPDPRRGRFRTRLPTWIQGPSTTFCTNAWLQLNTCPGCTSPSRA